MSLQLRTVKSTKIPLEDPVGPPQGTTAAVVTSWEEGVLWRALELGVPLVLGMFRDSCGQRNCSS